MGFMSELFSSIKEEYKKERDIREIVEKRANEQMEKEFEKFLVGYPKLELIKPVRTWEDVENNQERSWNYYHNLEKKRKQIKKELTEKIRIQVEREKS